MTVYLITFKSLIRIYTASVSIAPYYSYGVVSLLDHVCRVNIFWNFIYLQDLSAVDFVYTCCAHALCSEVEGVNVLD